MNIRDGFCQSFSKQGFYESHQISAYSITNFDELLNEFSPGFTKVKEEKQAFFAGIMTLRQEAYSPVGKQLKEFGFNRKEVFRNKHKGNVLCYYQRLPEKLLEFKESEDGMSIVVTS